MSQEPADEVHITAKTVQLGDSNGALEFLCSGQSGLELRAAVEGIGAFAGLNLDELTGQLKPLGVRELMEGLPLSLDPQP